MPRFVPALGSATIVVVAAALALNFYANQPGLGGPALPAPLPATPDAWSRVVIESGPDGGRVFSLAASPRGLLAVVVDEDGAARLFASGDGRTWTPVPADQHPPLADAAPGSIRWAQGGAGAVVVGTDRGFLMVGDEVWASEDGYDWQRLASSADDPDLRQGRMLAAVAAGPGFVAAGTDNKAWYSEDGSDWSLAKVPPPRTDVSQQGLPAPPVHMVGIAVAGGRLVAWGYEQGLSEDVMWVSSDGRSWANVLDAPVAEATVAGGPNGFVASTLSYGAAAPDVGEVAWFSADGQAWERVDVFGSRWPEGVNDEGVPVKVGVESLAAASAGYVAVGADGECLLGSCQSREAAIWISADGRSWSRVPSDDVFSGAGAGGVVALGSRFVVGGESDGRPVTWISDYE